jgi:hypothetical protein
MCNIPSFYRKHQQNGNNAAMRNGKESSNIMKYASSLAMAAAAVCLAGCASAPKVAVVEPVGPAPMLGASSAGDGSLVIYSARMPAVIDLNRDQWLSEMEPGLQALRYEPAHTGYTVYTKSGQRVETVPNARDATDETPFIVALAPGAYRVEAQAINCDGNRITVMLPVVIKPGQTTVAHLEGGWRPQGYTESDVAKLPCGRVIGWRAPEGEFASAAKPQLN